MLYIIVIYHIYHKYQIVKMLQTSYKKSLHKYMQFISLIIHFHDLPKRQTHGTYFAQKSLFRTFEPFGFF